MYISGPKGPRDVGRQRIRWQYVFKTPEHQNGLVAFRPQQEEELFLPSGKATEWSKGNMQREDKIRTRTRCGSCSHCPAICWRVVVPLAVPFRFMWLYVEEGFTISLLGIYVLRLSTYQPFAFHTVWKRRNTGDPTATRSNVTWISQTWRFQMHIN
jgi:hypothetical protein